MGPIDTSEKDSEKRTLPLSSLTLAVPGVDHVTLFGLLITWSPCHVVPEPLAIPDDSVSER